MLLWPTIFPHMKTALTPDHAYLHHHHERRKAEELRKRLEHERRFLFQLRR
ncbi:MAG: hypothetical protein AAF386_03185 [Pseudomonadota bacterium]